VTTTITGPALVVPAELAPAVAAALGLLRERYRADAADWPTDLADLDAKCRSVATVLRDRAFPTGTPADLPKRRTHPETVGNGRTMTAEQLAERLGMTGRRVRQLAAAGQIEGTRTPTGWQFTASASRKDKTTCT